MPKWKQYNFSQKFKRQVNENIHFLIKFIYNILWFIKKNIKFGNYSFSLKQAFLNCIFSAYKPKHRKT